ncbi:MAG: hypothetical protein HC906_03910 [Bacteroidales bacterium]|nr:hypothetical protein [Bacteroidales bacterium]
MKKISLLELNYRSVSPLKTFFNLFRNERKNILLALTYLTIKHSPALILPIIIGNVIDAIVQGGPEIWKKITLNSVFILILFLQTYPCIPVLSGG